MVLVPDPEDVHPPKLPRLKFAVWMASRKEQPAPVPLVSYSSDVVVTVMIVRGAALAGVASLHISPAASEIEIAQEMKIGRTGLLPDTRCLQRHKYAVFICP